MRLLWFLSLLFAFVFCEEAPAGHVYYAMVPEDAGRAFVKNVKELNEKDASVELLSDANTEVILLINMPKNPCKMV